MQFINHGFRLACTGSILLAAPSLSMAEVAAPAKTSEISYVFDGGRNFGGGIKKGAFSAGSAHLSINVDSEGAGLWSGGTLHLETLIDHGVNPSAQYIGDLQTASNIADQGRTRMHQAWFEQKFGDFSLLVGRHDMNSEFYVSEYAALFTNSSFGIGPEITANVPVSIFPVAGAAARIAYQSDPVALRFAGYDGDPSTTSIADREGKFWIGEAEANIGNGRYKVGGWRHSLWAPPQKKRMGINISGTYGGYLLIDQPIASSETREVGLFLQLGMAQKDKVDISRYVGVGLHAKGVIPGRSDDEAGIAMAQALFSNRYLANTPGSKKGETAYETTYKIQLNDMLSIQPSFQYIANPSGDPTIKNARVGILRIGITL